MRTGILSTAICVSMLCATTLHAQLFWNTNGSAATWTSANWGTTAAGPFTTAWAANSNTFVPTALTIGGNVAFAGTGNDIWGMTVDLGAASRTITNNTTSTATRTFSGVIAGNSGIGLTLSGAGGSGGIVLNNSNTY